MIAIDTNVPVRFLTQDDPDQTRRVQRCFAAAKDRDESLFLNHIVLCECVRVLSYSYGFPKAALVDVLERLLVTKQFVIEDKPAAWAAVADYRDLPGRLCRLSDRYQESQCRGRDHGHVGSGDCEAYDLSSVMGFIQ